MHMLHYIQIARRTTSYHMLYHDPAARIAGPHWPAPARAPPGACDVGTALSGVPAESLKV